MFFRLSRFFPTACLVSFCMVAGQSDAGIINTLRGFSDSDPGWSGSLSGSFAASGGNTEEATFKGGARLQFRQGSEMFRLMGSGKYTSSGGLETARSLMAHLRHNHQLSTRWSSLAFLQVQENPFQRLESRTLVGAGARFDVVQKREFDLAVGAAAMWERERLDGQSGHSSYQRLSLFISSVFEIRTGVTLDGLVFYQPEWTEFSDCRLFGKIDLNLKLVGALTLFSGFQVEHDSSPPAGVEQTDWETTTGFKASF